MDQNAQRNLRDVAVQVGIVGRDRAERELGFRQRNVGGRERVDSDHHQRQQLRQFAKRAMQPSR